MPALPVAPVVPEVFPERVGVRAVGRCTGRGSHGRIHRPQLAQATERVVQQTGRVVRDAGPCEVFDDRQVPIDHVGRECSERPLDAAERQCVEASR